MRGTLMLRCARAFEIESDPNFFQLTDSNIYDGRDAFFRRRDAETQRRRVTDGLTIVTYLKNDSSL